MRDFVLPEMWDKLSVVVRTRRKLEIRSPKFETNSNIEYQIRNASRRTASRPPARSMFEHMAHADNSAHHFANVAAASRGRLAVRPAEIVTFQ
jgi:hypothetical protein